jgi:hypothetical protein
MYSMFVHHSMILHYIIATVGSYETRVCVLVTKACVTIIQLSLRLVAALLYQQTRSTSLT